VGTAKKGGEGEVEKISENKGVKNGI